MTILNVSTAEIDAVRTIVTAQQRSPFLQSRRYRNILQPPEHLENEEFWKQMVVCMCTSVQPSGPNSHVSRLARENPFPLALVTCEAQSDLVAHARETLSRHGLRFGPKIAAQIRTNLAWLQNGGWQTVHYLFKIVINTHDEDDSRTRIASERQASRGLMGRSGALAGFGPKQARNLWQCLGVTRYEIPLDIRVCKWINALPSDFRLNPKKLYANVPYYEEAMTHIQSVCREAEVLPCEFDAAVFASADEEEWPENDVVFGNARE
jgi:hypothetical protein